MSGFRNFMHPDLLSSMSVSSSLVTEISWDHLVYRNCSLFHQFQEQVATGLLGYDVSAVTILLKVLEGCNTIVQSLCESSQLSIGSSIFDIRPLLSGQVSARLRDICTIAADVGLVYIVNPSLEQRTSCPL